MVRHPIYTGILIGFLGMAIAISQVRGFIAFALIFLAFWIKLRMEEEWMRSQFGETYATSARQTAALVALPPQNRLHPETHCSRREDVSKGPDR